MSEREGEGGRASALERELARARTIIEALMDRVESAGDPATSAFALLEHTLRFEDLLAERTDQLARTNLRLRQEIAVRAALEADLERAKEEAVRSAHARADFLANMSHEIRTPMNGVLGVAQLLLSSSLDDEQAGLARTLERSAAALVAILDDILDASKIDAGRMTLEAAPFCLGDVARDVVALLAPKAAAKGVELAVRLDARVPRYVVGDAARLRQVVMNLVSNALKFTREGSVSVEIEHVATAEASARFRVSVRDTGVGIAAGEHQQVFERYRQAGPSTARTHGGTGLGLPISRQLVELMGGTMTLESELGRGTTIAFELTLPRAEAAAAEPPKVTAAARTTGGAPRRLQVLLAEDNEVNQLVARKMLAKLGCEVEVAKDGREAVAACEARAFDLVLMDCDMPELDGFEATRELRRREAERASPRRFVVALTAHALPSERQRCLESGMDDYLPKPLLLDQLRALVARVPERSGAAGG